jgi:hypothetical protein
MYVNKIPSVFEKKCTCVLSQPVNVERLAHEMNSITYLHGHPDGSMVFSALRV